MRHVDRVVAGHRIQLGDLFLQNGRDLRRGLAGGLDLSNPLEADLAIGTYPLALQVDLRYLRAMDFDVIRRLQNVVLRRDVHFVRFDERLYVLGVRRETPRHESG